jgi:hypothetical protein
MQILTVENKPFSLNDFPNEVDDSIRYGVLDNSNPQDPDFIFPPFVYLESFNSPAMVLHIDDAEVAIPIDWCIAVGDNNTATHIEVLPMTSLNARGFNALVFNPITGFRLDFGKIEIVDFYSDVKWHFPRMKPGHLLALPLSNKPNPPCIFIVKELSRVCEIIHLDRIL